MRKVELLPTRDCEVGYGPAGSVGTICAFILHLSSVRTLAVPLTETRTLTEKWGMALFTLSSPFARPSFQHFFQFSRPFLLHPKIQISRNFKLKSLNIFKEFIQSLELG